MNHKLKTMNASYSIIGQHLRLAGVYSNGGHQVTFSKQGQVTVWFDKVKNQFSDGVYQPLIDFYKNGGAVVIIVDCYSSGKPYQIRVMVKGKKMQIKPITEDELHQLMNSRSSKDPRIAQ